MSGEAKRKTGAVGGSVADGPYSALFILRRLRWIMGELQAGRPFTRRDVEERFAISRRQAAYDIALLRRLCEDAGERAVIEWDAAGCTYRLARPLRCVILF